MQTQPLQLRQRKNECEASQPDIIKPVGGGGGREFSMNPQRKFYSTEQKGRCLTLTVRERMRREAVKQ